MLFKVMKENEMVGKLRKERKKTRRYQMLVGLSSRI